MAVPSRPHSRRIRSVGRHHESATAGLPPCPPPTMTLQWIAGRLKIGVRTVGLDARPSNRGWIATVIAIGVALLVFHYIASANLIQDKLAMKLFRKPHGPKTIYYHLFLLCAPVFEEIVMRGYLYPAFRRGYGIVLSIVIIVLLTGITHSHPMLTSWPGAVLLGGIAIALCLLREWTGSLWNCILPHMAYNATLDFGFAIPLVVVLILFPLCTYEK
jgi:membrane protease YdiL (CAAX protease family)